MDRDEALKLLRGGPEGIAEWNRWRANGETIPDLSEADLSGTDLSGAVLSRADLRRAHLNGAHLNWADLNGADLSGAHLNWADLSGAHLNWAYLNGADLSGADLSRAGLSGAHLNGADLSGAICVLTSFDDLNLSQVKGLESIVHHGPSTIGTDTLIRSGGKIPEAFLRGCGLPDAWIEYIPYLIGSMSPIQFYSVFISYNIKDEEFAKRLHSRLEQEKLRVWFAPIDLQSGKKIHEQIDQAIRVYQKLLLVLSEHSMESRWVQTEVHKARSLEISEGKRKLFPISLVPFKRIKEWQSFYADLGEDVAQEIRKYFIPDFSRWKDHDAFEAAFARLMSDLKADVAAPAPSK